jgi:hypothetical protein
MALELSTTARLLASQTNIETQLILQVEGIPFIYGALDIAKLAKFGDAIKFGDAGLVFGGTINDPDGRPYISLEGTTTQISQQLEIDKGGVGSVQKFNVTLIDKDQHITQNFSPGANVTDILGSVADVYVSFGGSHPEDSIRIFNGVVTSQDAAPGAWRIGIDHPEFLKRTDVLILANTNLDGAISDVATTLSLVNTALFTPPANTLRSMVRIDDEIIEYSSISGNDLIGATRGLFGTIPVAHDDDATVDSYYVLEDNAIDLALKLMLSKEGNEPHVTDIDVESIIQVDGATSVTNGIFFNDKTIVDRFGLNLGDKMSITGDANGANNFTDRTIQAFSEQSNGIVIVVDGAALVVSVGSAGLASFNSAYNVLPAGAGMKMSQVDVAQHLRFKQLFPTLPSYQFKIKDTISPLKDFLTEEVYRPSGFYQVPRKGRSSVNSTLPPLALDELIELNETNTKKASKNKITRSVTGSTFFNAVTYKFNEDALEDRFLASETVFSAKSTTRIKVPNKVLSIKSKGFIDNAETRNYIAAQTRRFSDRYQFATETISVQLLYRNFNIEIGDIVLYGSPELQIPNISTANRDFEPRLFEVIQKKLNIRGQISLTLLDTGFSQDGNFRTISPNSFVGSGSTVSTIVLKRSFSTGEFEVERTKWENMIGEDIEIRNEDSTFSEVVKLVSFDPGSDDKIIISPPLSLAPPEDYLVDLPDYPTSTDSSERSKMKSIFGFIDPTVTIVSAASDTEFTVAPADIDKFTVDAFLLVHDSDYSVVSTADSIDDDAQVLTINTGTNTITTNQSLGFTPLAGYECDLIGFQDGGVPYRVL